MLSLSPELDTLRWEYIFRWCATNDAAFALKRDAFGDVFVAGATTSSSFPVDTSSAYNTYLGGQTDAFVSKFNSNGTQLLASSFFRQHLR